MISQIKPNGIESNGTSHWIKPQNMMAHWWHKHEAVFAGTMAQWWKRSEYKTIQGFVVMVLFCLFLTEVIVGQHRR